MNPLSGYPNYHDVDAFWVPGRTMARVNWTTYTGSEKSVLFSGASYGWWWKINGPTIALLGKYFIKDIYFR